MSSEGKKEEHRNMLISEYRLDADLCVPTSTKAIILFAHGSGSSRHSTKNQYVAQILNNAGFSTLLVDLLNQEEKEIDSRTRHLRFDIGLLASRIESITRWILQYPNTRDLSIGYFGSSTGAAATIIAASKFDNIVKAIVSRGGRPDLAEEGCLHKIFAPTLLIVGGNDLAVLAANKRILNDLKHAEAKELVIIPEAGHIFEEQDKMQVVAKVAVDWFECFLLRTGKKFENKYNTEASRFLSGFKIKDMLQLKFNDRVAAGKMLAALLGKYKNGNPIVIGIPRGGVIVADAIARKLSADFDIVVPRRLRAPNNSEDALGAIMQDGSVYLDRNLVRLLDVSEEYIEAEKLEQRKEIDRRLSLYRPGPKEYEVKDKTAIVVDDGAATGSTLIAAARWLRKQQPKRLVIALPVAPKKVAEVLKHEADYVEFVKIAGNFRSVSNFYIDYSPITDEQVLKLISNDYDKNL
jgi:putative phosphoribosyl transferase